MFGGVGAITTMGGFDGLNQELTIKLFGHSFGLIGSKGFFLSGTYDVAVFALVPFPDGIYGYNSYHSNRSNG